MWDAISDWIRRHSIAVGFSLALIAAILIKLYVSSADRGFAGKITAVIIAVAITCASAYLPRPRAAATIGAHLRRTYAFFLRILIPLIVGWVAAVTLYVQHQQAQLLGAGVALYLIAVMIVKRRLRCPRCGTDFRQERAAELGPLSMDPRSPGELWDACPHCGVSFNDPLP
jgi:ribosomal protein S27AE